VEAISGERMITFSRSLADLRTTESQMTDEEIAEIDDDAIPQDQPSENDGDAPSQEDQEEWNVVASFDLPNTPWFNRWWYTTNEHTKLLKALENDGETGLKLFIEEVRRRYEE
jgi:hypothetical protein